jgi:hypothetical protein
MRRLGWPSSEGSSIGRRSAHAAATRVEPRERARRTRDPQDRVLAPWWWLALVPLATLLIVTVATSVPARLATRIPAADALRYE